jgi:hypothetical protein
MEHLWSTAGATGGNQSQVEGRQKRLKRAKSVAVGCDRLPPGPHGKEGVSGSSPEEGLKYLQIESFCCPVRRNVGGDYGGGHVRGHLQELLRRGNL